MDHLLHPRLTTAAAMALALLSGACQTQPDDAELLADAVMPSTRPVRAWSVQGMRIPAVNQNTPEDALMGPDASLAGPGPLEESLANQPIEPLPEDAALGHTSGATLPDGSPAPENPLLHTGPIPRSPYDPAAAPTPAEGSNPGQANPEAPAPGQAAPAAPDTPSPAAPPAQNGANP